MKKRIFSLLIFCSLGFIFATSQFVVQKGSKRKKSSSCTKLKANCCQLSVDQVSKIPELLRIIACVQENLIDKIISYLSEKENAFFKYGNCEQIQSCSEAVREFQVKMEEFTGACEKYLSVLKNYDLPG
jgi:hypothetical protein